MQPRGDPSSDTASLREMNRIGGRELFGLSPAGAYMERNLMGCIYLILYFRRRLSAIMAINSEFVGFPRLFCTVYPK